ncbi:DNA primase large subunit PriL [Thermococcus sp.]|uniref:DNA primase large subunit PriL n=1 Tax=Thermococcus sp. TaxID=35749 RepID=UPI0026359A6D|nr:DNA primase large subunit PriL [Thermococcus sp.]
MKDPFGKDAERLIREEFGDLLTLLQRIPSSMSVEDVLTLIEWVLTSDEPPEELLRRGPLEETKDVFRFYAILGALALSPYGIELELVENALVKLYGRRVEGSDLSETMLKVEEIKPGDVPERDRKILEKPMDRNVDPSDRERRKLRYKMELKEFLELWDGSLKEVYIRGGYAYLTQETALQLWERAFARRIERASRLLSEMSDELPGFYEKLREKLREIAEKHFRERLEKLGKVGAQPLRFDLFPPCVKEALKGVPAGMRNYAITVLLTSFLSYARICPNPPRKDIRVRDCVESLDIIEREILPVIIEAGNRCTPPLFEDQPHEIKNVWYHLGFGLTDRPTLEDSGNSTWYFPPNCDKIRANAPSLCKPDKYCRGIKNPLTYYLRKLAREGRRDVAEGSE